MKNRKKNRLIFFYLCSFFSDLFPLYAVYVVFIYKQLPGFRDAHLDPSRGLVPDGGNPGDPQRGPGGLVGQEAGGCYWSDCQVDNLSLLVFF